MDSIYYAGRTIGYFIVWGIIFGSLSAEVSGWLLRPLGRVGYGHVIGFGCGLLAGFIMAAVQTLVFHRDIDLRVYQRWTALGIGVLVAVMAPLIALVLLDGYLNVLEMVAALVASAFWGGLSGAHITRHHAVWYALLSLGKPEESKIAPLLPPAAPIKQEAEALFNKFFNIKSLLCLYGPLALVALMLYVLSPESHTSLLYSMNSLGPVIGPCLFLIAGILVVTFVLGTVLGANVFLLTLLKKVLFKDYHLFSAHTTRVILTIISFVWTLALCRWMLVLAPIVTAVIAYHVYHSIALPDTGTDKAKRKEEASSALVLDEPMERMAIVSGGDAEQQYDALKR